MLVLVLFISLVTSAYCDDTREIHGYSYFYTHGKPGDISLITRINVLPVTWGLAYCPTSGADPHPIPSHCIEAMSCGDWLHIQLHFLNHGLWAKPHHWHIVWANLIPSYACRKVGEGQY